MIMARKLIVELLLNDKEKFSEIVQSFDYIRQYNLYSQMELVAGDQTGVCTHNMELLSWGIEDMKDHDMEEHGLDM